nr:SCO family protein [Govania unica]
MAWKLTPNPAGDEPPGGTALVGGPFSLVDQTGKRVTDQDFRGRYMLVFFGYTFCPDVCPMELSSMTEAMDLLPKNIAAKVQPIFITVDPTRDTVPVMAEFVQNFSPKLIGLTGTEDEIKAASRAYRVYYQKSVEGTETEYLMDHSAIVFVMGPKGQYVAHFSAGVSPEMMAKKLQDIVG